MDSLTLLMNGIQQLPTASQVVIIALLIMLLSAVLLKVRQRKQLLKPDRTSTDSARQAPMPGDAPSEPPASAREDAEDSATTAEVYEVDPLQEVEIYLSFGHLEQAAATLRWHIEHYPDDLANCLRLMDLYLEIPDMGGYAEIQEKLCTLSADRNLLHETITRGLLADPGNLHLRVLAETYLGMDPDTVDRFLTLNRPADFGQPASKSQPVPVEAASAIVIEHAQNALKQALVNPEPLDLSGLEPAIDKSTQGWTAVQIGVDDMPLLRGKTGLEGRLDPLEARIINTFMSPVQAAVIHLELGTPDTAIDSLRRAILFEPRKLGNHVELLKTLYQLRRVDHYAQALLSLYLTLWGAGKSLRERLLSLGARLGEHPLLQQLQGVEQRGDGLASLADAWGLNIPLAAIPFSHPALVEERVRSGYSVAPENSGDPIMFEFDQLLEFGQVEEAVFLLEDTLAREPQQTRYFRPLMEMYERTADLQRYGQFAESILQNEHLPSEETLQFMLETGERLKRQVKTRAV